MKKKQICLIKVWESVIRFGVVIGPLSFIYGVKEIDGFGKRYWLSVTCRSLEA